MTVIRVDCGLLGRRALRLMRNRMEIRRLMHGLDGEVRALPAGWQGDDELHFAARWDAARTGALAGAGCAEEACAAALFRAARIYRDAQIDLINTAMHLPR